MHMRPVTLRVLTLLCAVYGRVTTVPNVEGSSAGHALQRSGRAPAESITIRSRAVPPSRIDWIALQCCGAGVLRALEIQYVLSLCCSDEAPTLDVQEQFSSHPAAAWGRYSCFVQNQCSGIEDFVSEVSGSGASPLSFMIEWDAVLHAEDRFFASSGDTLPSIVTDVLNPLQVKAVRECFSRARSARAREDVPLDHEARCADEFSLRGALYAVLCNVVEKRGVHFVSGGQIPEVGILMSAEHANPIVYSTSVLIDQIAGSMTALQWNTVRRLAATLGSVEADLELTTPGSKAGVSVSYQLSGSSFCFEPSNQFDPDASRWPSRALYADYARCAHSYREYQLARMRPSGVGGTENTGSLGDVSALMGDPALQAFMGLTLVAIQIKVCPAASDQVTAKPRDRKPAIAPAGQVSARLSTDQAVDWDELPAECRLLDLGHLGVGPQYADSYDSDSALAEAPSRILTRYSGSCYVDLDGIRSICHEDRAYEYAMGCSVAEKVVETQVCGEAWGPYHTALGDLYVRVVDRRRRPLPKHNEVEYKGIDEEVWRRRFRQYSVEARTHANITGIVWP